MELVQFPRELGHSEYAYTVPIRTQSLRTSTLVGTALRLKFRENAFLAHWHDTVLPPGDNHLSSRVEDGFRGMSRIRIVIIADLPH